jgi:hypothetical protein
MFLDFGFIFQPVFLAFQQVIQFSNQLQEPAMIPFLFNHRAQLIHAFSFFWFHRRWDGMAKKDGGRTIE